MGRPRKPTHLHVVEGTFRGSRHSLNIPKPDEELGEPSPDLSDAQRALWNDVKRVAAAGLLKECDRSVVEAYVVLWDQRRKCGQLIGRSGGGPLVRSTDHRVTRAIENPALRLFRRLTEGMRALEQELGFGPSSRSKISTPIPVGQEDELLKYLS
jgi:P27 family predicted phage terminase small subunit